MLYSNDRSLVLLSGGQDSTVCLFWAKETFKEVSALSICYGQRHAREVVAANTIAKLAGVPFELLDIGNAFSKINDSSLISDNKNLLEKHRDGILPSSFVPGRNIILLTYAAAYAYKHNIRHIVAGMCETDYSGYPDCREPTIKCLQQTLIYGMEFDFLRIHTPLMHKTKAWTVKWSNVRPYCWKALGYSYTCYEGKPTPCGICPACKLRARGFKEAGLNDPALKKE